MKIAVLGAGAMGSRMAHRLIATGQHRVTVWNRTADRLRPLVDAGATAAGTPAEAARRQDLVLSMLRDDDAARSVWLDPDHGALPAMTSGTVAADSSTVTPSWSRELAARCTDHGVAFLDAPVAGSRPQADAGALIFFVGGDPATLPRVEPILRTLGGAVHHVGPVGAGTQLKLAVNALFAIQLAAAAELLSALHGTDLDPGRAAAVLAETPVASPATAAATTAMLQQLYVPAFPIDLVAKDLRYVTAQPDAALPLTRAAAEIYERAAAQGHGNDNITGIIQLYLH